MLRDHGSLSNRGPDEMEARQGVRHVLCSLDGEVRERPGGQGGLRHETGTERVSGLDEQRVVGKVSSVELSFCGMLQPGQRVSPSLPCLQMCWLEAQPARPLPLLLSEPATLISMMPT